MRKILVTSALPYANGPIHMGHLVEYIQTDIWVRFQKAVGNECLYFCADDTHGTPIMLRARKEGVSPEELIARAHPEHKASFDSFGIECDNFYTTHSDENAEFSTTIFNRLKEAGDIRTDEIEQAYCRRCGMFLPDRYIIGTCPKCKSADQYGDSCDSCAATYHATDLIDSRCATCGAKPATKKSVHYFFKLSNYADFLKKFIADGYTQKTIANKLDEWLVAGLKDRDISRDGPYFGFKIPGEDNKYFYVWLDAPIGYMASCKNYCDANGLDFDKVWGSEEYELYHFIGKDIVNFHALLWPAMLKGSGFRLPNKLFVHGFLTVNGVKMSKSKGTFIKADTYAKHLEPEYLRYYYASKLNSSVEDIDLNLADFEAKINSDLIGKLANLASRCVPMLVNKLESKLGCLDEQGAELIEKLAEAKEKIVADFEGLNFASAIRTIASLADEANRYVENNQPWATIKTDTEKTRATLTAALNAMRILTIYLKPVLPNFAAKVERILSIAPLSFADVGSVIENHKINEYVRLAERVDSKKVEAMLEESKNEQAAEGPVENAEPVAAEAGLDEPLTAECTIDDFVKVDLRVAQIASAAAVDGADKLLAIELDLGPVTKNVFAGIAKAYKPEELVGRKVICVANLKPRKMRFGVSEGMILAAGPGGSDIFILSPDDGAQPGQRVH
ncbi:MAG: methionine--tRNA ligase [Anaerohalosphaeraceae bacterium]|nr:methionine--tRNA ligase [Anaerohalosphaeraceae bacterium]